MKKTLTIILLSISLSGFSQTEKGDFVVTPTVGWNTIYYKNVPEDSEDFQVKLPIGFHKYLSDRFALGLVTTFGYYRNQPYVSNVYYKIQSYIAIQPEARYNFLKTRFTPFVGGRILNIVYQSNFFDNPAIPAGLRRISNLQFTEGLKIDVGVSYFIRDRFGLQVKLMDLNVLFNRESEFKAYLPINFGLQFIINNPRSEIELPR